jgi:hypothetical protein
MTLAGICSPIDEVVEALQPDKAGQFKSSLLVIFWTNSLGICQHLLNMFDHHSVKHTRSGILVLLPFLPVLGLGNPMGALRMLVPLFLNLLGQLILSGTRRTEFSVE